MSQAGTALITGASSGIGATYAKRLAARGYDLILVARDQVRLTALADVLTQQHAIHVTVMAADLTDEQDLQRVESELANNAQITLLLNNAGMDVEGGFLEADSSRINSMLALNILAPTRLAQIAGRAFKARGHGIIINVASVLSLVHEMFNGAYNATKSYVLTLTRTMQRELAESGVQVQAVLPGATRTEIFERAGNSINNIPAEMLMDVDEMVDAALAGLDSKEAVTIPALEDLQMWYDYDQARGAMIPHLSWDKSASRYRQG
ncbi:MULTISPECIES: SDR family oxidoreductase [unclassified Pantoea]|uniref:SDR family NAD(P)-dependent oxidoreductase n=1 Tax=unclassified Pantoea TaxID=2630326 RepID=UPI0023DCA1BB|nr:MULTISPECIES: SDR family oxidoreductase [unclassified Pantoea]MDF2042475.1 SDR family oxidoreductase [Pantoea sp. Cr_R14]MDF2072820.1 SDR family oxidoreductase [Pantoea sp. Cr_R13]MDF2079463.1 SDR family oxidoreductase [Pantoea sp. Cr_R21]